MTYLLAWLVLAGPVWGVAGGAATPRRYRARGLDPRLARTAGALVGLALGVAGLAWLLGRTPRLDRALHVLVPSLLLLAELLLLFRVLAPANVCVTSPGYVAGQVQNGLVVGAIFGTMAIGLALIFSVLGVVNFAHGQFVMFGGVIAFLLLTQVLQVNAIFVIPLVGVAAFALGALVERGLLTPLHRGKVERKDEYAILITFGFGIFLQYSLLGGLGPTSGVRAPRYTDRPLLGIDQSTFTLGALRFETNYLIAAAIGLVLCGVLTWFLKATWAGRGLRAVSMNQQAATVAGIDPARTYTLAFGVGAALTGMAGAALVPVLNFPVPEVATAMAVRAFVIIVLGGLGSVPGAFLGGLFVGVVEALGAGCYPDPSKGAVYQPAFGLLIFALVLLLRPQGFFGRKV